MGILKSVARRWELSRNHPPGEAVRVFFASKARRRSLRNARNSGSSRERVTGDDDRNVLDPVRIEAASYLDKEWYAAANNLAEPGDALDHFLTRGLALRRAPSPAFVEARGKLPWWGYEFLARVGLPVGQKGIGTLHPGDPGALRPFSISNPELKPLAVVCASFGEPGRLASVDPGWDARTDFYLFTDRVFEAPGLWQPVHANFHHPDLRRRALFFKTHLPVYFSAYEHVMWVDSDILICRDPMDLLGACDMTVRGLTLFRDPQRGSFIDKAAGCARDGLDNAEAIARHLRAVAGHPARDTGPSFATAVVVVKPEDAGVREMCTRWWAWQLRGSKEDRLSLPFAVHESEALNWDHFPNDCLETSPYFARLQQ